MIHPALLQSLMCEDNSTHIYRQINLVLRIFSPVSNIKVMPRCSINLTHNVPGQAQTSQAVDQYYVHILLLVTVTDKYFMINLYKSYEALLGFEHTTLGSGIGRIANCTMQLNTAYLDVN